MLHHNLVVYWSYHLPGKLTICSSIYHFCVRHKSFNNSFVVLFVRFIFEGGDGVENVFIICCTVYAGVDVLITKKTIRHINNSSKYRLIVTSLVIISRKIIVMSCYALLWMRADWNVYTKADMHEIGNWIKNSIKWIKLNGVVSCVIDGWRKISIFNEIFNLLKLK